MPQLTTQTLKTWQLRPLDGQTRLALPPPDAVHLWLLSLDQPLRPLAGLTVTLDPAEHARAARFHFAHDRLRFIAARGQLRTQSMVPINVQPVNRGNRDDGGEGGASAGTRGLRTAQSGSRSTTCVAREG